MGRGGPGDRVMGLLLALSCGLLGVCARLQPGPEGQARVVFVIDGDTVIVSAEGGREERVRILGINAPEIAHPEHPGARPAQCWGEEATRAARELLPEGASITLQRDPKTADRDRYTRPLRYVKLPDGRDFGQVMVQEGNAFEASYGAAYTRWRAYVAAQDGAKNACRGRWAACGRRADGHCAL